MHSAYFRGDSSDSKRIEKGDPYKPGEEHPVRPNGIFLLPSFHALISTKNKSSWLLFSPLVGAPQTKTVGRKNHSSPENLILRGNVSKLTLILILFLMSPCSIAEWNRVEAKVKGLRIYVDYSTISDTETGTVKMWDLFDYEKEVDSREVRYSSAKTLREYDCKEHRYRDAAWAWYSGNMGEGKVVFSYLNNGTPRDWNALEPSDIDYHLMGIACGRRGFLALPKSPQYSAQFQG